MPEFLCTGTLLACKPFGAAPNAFQALPLPAMPREQGSLPVAGVNQIVPLTNIPSFGMCSSPQNPQVAAATTAALGVLTPMPCVPAPAGPWQPASQVASGMGIPLATTQSTCKCAYGGTISVSLQIPGEPGQTA